MASVKSKKIRISNILPSKLTLGMSVVLLMGAIFLTTYLASHKTNLFQHANYNACALNMSITPWNGGPNTTLTAYATFSCPPDISIGSMGLDCNVDNIGQAYTVAHFSSYTGHAQKGRENAVGNGASIYDSGRSLKMSCSTYTNTRTNRVTNPGSGFVTFQCLGRGCNTGTNPASSHCQSQSATSNKNVWVCNGGNLYLCRGKTYMQTMQSCSNGCYVNPGMNRDDACNSSGVRNNSTGGGNSCKSQTIYTECEQGNPTFCLFHGVKKGDEAQVTNSCGTYMCKDLGRCK